MKIGISVTTCDRLKVLRLALDSLGKKQDAVKVIVDNGTNTRKQVEDIAGQLGYHVIDGNKSNSPHGQNLAFEYLLKKGCDAILKSDDDYICEPNYLDYLSFVLAKYDNVGAVTGICWATPRKEFISFINGDWYTESGARVHGEQFAMWRFKNPTVAWKARHLTGAYLYRVEDALKLREKTKDLRGGPFGEYFSRVAGREETEFTLLLRQILHKDLLVVPQAIVYHTYAPGGTRKFNVGKLVEEDNAKFLEVCRRLGADSTTSPAWIEPAKEIDIKI